MSDNYSRIYKVIVIGDSGVGKSNIVSRFVDDTFTNVARSTIGIDFQMQTVKLGDETIKLQIWDSAGQERFRSLCRSYYRYAASIVIVFDLTRRSSFNNIEKWIDEIEKNSDGDLTHIELLLIGNKSDLIDKREVFDDDITNLRDTFSFVYLETSAKDNIGINEGLTKLAQRIHNNRHYIYKHRNHEDLIVMEDNYNVSNDENAQSGCRCAIQ